MSFWSNKLGADRGPTPPAVTDVHAWWATERQEKDAVPTWPSQTVGMTRKRSGDANCPECGSGNYMQPTRNTAFRCFDCNYPNLQSTSGAHIGSATPYGQPVRQVTGSGWHPQEIIGRIG